MEKVTTICDVFKLIPDSLSVDEHHKLIHAIYDFGQSKYTEGLNTGDPSKQGTEITFPNAYQTQPAA